MTAAVPAEDTPRPHTPDRSLEQRMHALQHANRVRIHRAELKKKIAAGRTSVYDVLAARHDEKLATMKLVDLLLAVPRLGRVKATDVLRRARCSPSKTLGGLTDRQACELAIVLGAYPSLRRH